MPARRFKQFADLATSLDALQAKDPDENVFGCLELPSAEEIGALADKLHCTGCKTRTMKIVAAQVNEPAATLLARCKSCLQEGFLFVSTWQRLGSDIAVFEGVGYSARNAQLFAQFKCPKCSALFEKLTPEPSSFGPLVVLPYLAACSKCPETFNVVFLGQQKAKAMDDDIFKGIV